MKNTRVTARRILQGSAAFAALGALSIATALPAAADTQTVGWAHANVADGLGIAETYITPKGEEGSASNGGTFALDDYLSIDASTSATVNASGATSTTTVNSAHLQLTASDVDAILDEVENPDDEPEDEPSPSETPSEEPSPGGETDGEGDDAGDGTDGDDTDDTDGDGSGAGDGEGETGGETGGETDEGADETEEPGEGAGGSQEPGDETGGTGTEGGSGDDETGGESDDASEAPAATASAEEIVTLDAEDTAPAANGDEIILDATISGASVTTTQSWNGDVSHTFEGGSVSIEVNELDVKIDPLYIDDGTYTSEDAGFDWDDAYTALLVDITVPGHFELGYALGVTYASTGVPSEGDSGNGGGAGGGNGDDGKDEDKGDDKNPPNRDPETLPKPEPKATESLAQTGSPVGGLIAAGAAIAAGGGAAAYFARRKKNTADSAAETSEG